MGAALSHRIPLSSSGWELCVVESTPKAFRVVMTPVPGVAGDERNMGFDAQGIPWLLQHLTEWAKKHDPVTALQLLDDISQWKTTYEKASTIAQNQASP